MDDPLVHQTELMDEEFAHVSIPGDFVVDTLLARVSQTSTLVGRLLDPTFVLSVPDWFPGTVETAQLGREWGQMRALVDTIFELIQVWARRVRSPFPGLHCLFVRIHLIQAVDVSVPSFTDENIMEGITEQEEVLVKRQPVLRS
jgi:hypothetical protein